MKTTKRLAVRGIIGNHGVTLTTPPSVTVAAGQKWGHRSGSAPQTVASADEHFVRFEGGAVEPRWIFDNLVAMGHRFAA